MKNIPVTRWLCACGKRVYRERLCRSCYTAMKKLREDEKGEVDGNTEQSVRSV